MTDSAPTKGKPVSVEDLVALNDEIASLVRAGVPLELGISSAANDFDGALGNLTHRLSDRLHGGASLSEALEAESDIVPPVYRAIVETGLHAGRLPEALESMTRFARSVSDLRRRIGLAFVYPTTIFVIAYALFVAFVIVMVPQLEEAFAIMNLPVQWWLVSLSTINDTVPFWVGVFPLAILLICVWWRATARSMITPMSGGPSISLLPGMSRIISNFHFANFAEVLAMLIDHKVPLHKALTLAANSTGTPPLIIASQSISDELQKGKSIEDSFSGAIAFPAFMRWMMRNGARQGNLVPVLDQVTDIYRRRAAHQSEWYKLVLPVLLVVLIGGGATFVYAMTLFYPLSRFLRELSAG